MKNTLSKKIITVILIPFLIIFGVLLAIIAYSVTQYVNNWTELELKGISEINAADLAGRIDSVIISVLSTANILENESAHSDNSREQAEEAIKSMFINKSIYNVWLTYEPQAFDGMDALDTDGYPGAPSGRFIRSYIMEDGQAVTAPDMDEAIIDDPAECPWYTIPRDTGELYIDLYNELPNLYDYNVGGDDVYALSIVSPILRDGKVIGCVGADVNFDKMTFGIDNSKQAVIAVFYPNGRIFYSPSIAYAEESVDTLKFTHSSEIKEAVAEGKALFLPDEYAVFIDEQAFTYIQPIVASDQSDNCLSLYVAIPKAAALDRVTPIFIIIGIAIVTILITLLALFIYVSGKITKPIVSLTLAADAISQGDLETEIESFMNTKDEIGVLSRSLHRMVEQFRVYIIHMEQTQEEKEVFSRLDDFTKADSSFEAINGLTAMLCRQFKASKTSMIFMDGGRARVFSRFDGDCEFEVSESNYPDFMHHRQVNSLLIGKKLLYMNTSAINQLGIEFLSKETVAACILPICAENNLCGYIIFESNDKNQTINIRAESILVHVAKTIADWWMKNREKQQEPKPLEPIPAETLAPQENAATNSGIPDEPKLSAFNGIAGLDSDSAIAAMGGLSDIYEQSVKLMNRLLPKTIEKLDLYLTEDLNAFAIEIHGLKGSLNNIGAYGLGNMASRMEQMAKDGDAGGCAADLPSFKESLSELHRGISEVLKSAEDKPPGDKDILMDALERTDEALRSFDTLEALDLMQPLASYSYDTETETIISEIICALETFDSERASINIQKLRGMII